MCVFTLPAYRRDSLSKVNLLRPVLSSHTSLPVAVLFICNAVGFTCEAWHSVFGSSWLIGTVCLCFGYVRVFVLWLWFQGSELHTFSLQPCSQVPIPHFVLSSTHLLSVVSGSLLSLSFLHFLFTA